MNLPIVAYGHPTLKKVAAEIEADYPGLNDLIANMFETMYFASGVGLAAPQVNYSIRLFIVDGTVMVDDFPELAEFKKVFINPTILEDRGEDKKAEEGCLSIPHIREVVERPDIVRIEYYDEKWQYHDEVFEGMASRIIQHEYDHLEGILFVEKISPLRKTIISRKLREISAGNVDVEYQMIFPSKKKLK